jgi:MYXO-CTERM domain-containing protein
MYTNRSKLLIVSVLALTQACTAESGPDRGGETILQERIDGLVVTSTLAEDGDIVTTVETETDEHVEFVWDAETRDATYVTSSDDSGVIPRSYVETAVNEHTLAEHNRAAAWVVRNGPTVFRTCNYGDNLHGGGGVPYGTDPLDSSQCETLAPSRCESDYTGDESACAETPPQIDTCFDVCINVERCVFDYGIGAWGWEGNFTDSLECAAGCSVAAGSRTMAPWMLGLFTALFIRRRRRAAKHR